MSVDDEPDLEMLIRQKFRRQIKKNEYEFVFAHNGLEALSLLVEHPDISVILSDINMPEMDGLTLLSKINELKNPTLKTIIVSAYGDMDNIRCAMNRGAFDFATKPIDFEDLEITIRRTIEQIEVLKHAQEEHNQLVAIQNDLNVAREIQLSILPKVFPPFPEYGSFDLFATMHAAKSVGGDFYDFFLIDDDHLGLVMADVSDKGIPAAIYMAVSKTIIRATALKGMPPNECMAYSNALLCKDNASSMFVTTFYSIMTISTGKIIYCNAGHNPPYLVKPNGSVVQLEKTGDLVLGAIEDVPFHNKDINLEPGDWLYMYTDGVTEAMNIDNELYNEDRLELALTHLQDTPEALIEYVSKDLKAYTGEARQSDDITMMALIYKGIG